MSVEAWCVIGLAGLMVAANVAYLVWYQRRAYIGERFIQAMGSYQAAAQWLAVLEEEDDARLAGALSIHNFTKGKKT